MDIDKLIKYATLDKAGAAKEAYRAIKAELLLNNSSKNPKPEGKVVNTITFSRNEIFKIEINELDLSIIKKQIQIHDEQISMYDANSRKDLADLYREQNKILKFLLPPEISENVIQEAITSAYPNGFTKKEMGKVIKEIKAIYPTADGKLISECVKKYLI